MTTRCFDTGYEIEEEAEEMSGKWIYSGKKILVEEAAKDDQEIKRLGYHFLRDKKIFEGWGNDENLPSHTSQRKRRMTMATGAREMGPGGRRQRSLHKAQETP